MSSLAGSKEAMSGGRKVHSRTGQAKAERQRPLYDMLQRSLGNARLAEDNRRRQESITKELLDIVGGAEAVG